MKNAGLSSQGINSKELLEKDIEVLKSKLSKTETEFTNEKNRLQSEIDNLKDLNAKLEKDRSNSLAECKTMAEEKKRLETDIARLNVDISKYVMLQ